MATWADLNKGNPVPNQSELNDIKIGIPVPTKTPSGADPHPLDKASARALTDAEKATVLYLTLPDDAAIGNSYDVKINGEARRVLWQDADTLVIGPDDSDDVRTILSHYRSAGLITFFCTARGADA